MLYLAGQSARRLSVQTESSFGMILFAVLSLLTYRLGERKDSPLLPPSAPFLLTSVIIRLTESMRFLIRTLKLILDVNAVVK